jgi:protein-S-isoprenylcysteine O-methyltransferase Ste14
MSRRMGWLLALYPRAWRKRYGREVAALTEDLIGAGTTTPLRAGLNLAATAAVEWARAVARVTHAGTLSLVVRNLMFTIVVPGLGGAWMPWWLLTRDGRSVTVAAWEAVPVIAAGTALYVWCVWNFASVGRGTPGPWDAPSRVVAAGPYRWVRNPIYLAALLVVLGQAWLFLSLPLLAYAAAMAIVFHLFVIGYEERTLGHRFGPDYLEYRRTVPRWLLRPPRRSSSP